MLIKVCLTGTQTWVLVAIPNAAISNIVTFVKYVRLGIDNTTFYL